MLDIVTMHTATGTPVSITAKRPFTTRKYGCQPGQAFCFLCVAGNHAHPDGYGRPEYHCPSSRVWVGWQRVSFNRAGTVQCSCEHGQVMAAKGLPARCAGHALYALWRIERGDWDGPDELGAMRYPVVIESIGGELFDEDEVTAPSSSARHGALTLEDLYAA